MSTVLRAAALAGAILLASCSDSAVHEPTPSQSQWSGPGDAGSDGATRVRALSRNLYVGADVDAVIAALATPDPSDDLPALAEAIATLQATDFPARVAAMADEIARSAPHMVGLQEVFTIDLDLTGLGLPIVIHLPFLPLLQQELAARGLNYVVAARQVTTQANPLPGISLVDSDVLLVDASRVQLGAAGGNVFGNNIGVVAPGVNILRGWVMAEATIDGRAYTLVNTHLESGSAPGLDQLRAVQALELVQVLGAAAPVVLTGDLNDVPGSLMYQVFQGAGFADVWGELRPGAAGYTCCHESDLSNERSGLDERIDYILARGTGHPIRGVQGRIDILGDQRRDRIPGPLYRIWPSDHAGLVAELLTPP